MLHHLFKKHPHIHAEIMRCNPSTKARKVEGERVGSKVRIELLRISSRGNLRGRGGDKRLA